MPMQSPGQRAPEGIAWPVLFVTKQQFNIMASFPIIQVTEGQQRSLRLWDVSGVKFPGFFTKHPALLADYISNFETRPDDVFVVSYPKSGSCIFIVILSQSDNWIMFSNVCFNKTSFLDKLSLWAHLYIGVPISLCERRLNINTYNW